VTETPPSADGPERSPLLLGGSPGRGAGVRRLNRVPLLIVASIGAVLAAGIGYTYHLRSQKAAEQLAEEKKRPESAGAAVLVNAPTAGEIAARRPPPPAPPAPETRPASAALPSAAASLAPDGVTPPASPGEDLQAEARKKAWQDHYQQLAELDRTRAAAWRSALQADTQVKANGPEDGPAPTTPRPDPGVPGGAESPALPPTNPTAATAGTAWLPGMAGFGASVLQTPQVDTSAARARQAWLDRPGATGADDYLQATLHPPLSPYEVKAGTPIQAKMVGGVNSDAPGLIVGQVTENVYDTATGHFLLIPQGARLVGSYDNSITNGQTRIVVGWNRIIFPDGWSIDLGNMPGADESGYAGFHDQVDNHLWQKLGNALLITVAGAAAQLSQPQASNGENFNPTQILAASLGQQFALLGQLYAQAGLAIPPTLEIRPGYPFVVMVRKDMLLQPYVDHRSEGTPVSLGPVMQ